MAPELHAYPDIAYGTGTDGPTDPDEQRALWKWEAAIGYRMFAALRWGQLGDGHITCRDPQHRDRFWMLSYGVPFRRATVHDLILIGPDGSVVEGPSHATANTADQPLGEEEPAAASGTSSEGGIGDAAVSAERPGVVRASLTEQPDPFSLLAGTRRCSRGGRSWRGRERAP